MHLTIISGATRPRKKSNTAKIISAFLMGFQKCGHTAEVWYLSDRTSWAGARAAFCENSNILFALPLYVENIPGTMLEFLESLPPKTTPGTRLSFLVQGGFPEASQGRCCECFLKTLPEQLGWPCVPTPSESGFCFMPCMISAMRKLRRFAAAQKGQYKLLSMRSEKFLKNFGNRPIR